MIDGKRIFTNTILLILSSVISLGISLVTTSLIARSIGPELYGKYTFGLTYVLLFSVLANFGLESLFIREAARDRENISKMIFDILHLKVLLAVFTIGAIVVSINLLKYPSSTINIVYILCIGLFFQILSNSVLAVYRSLEKMGLVACFGLAFRVISAFVIIGSIYFKVGLVGIVSAFSIGNAAVFIGSILLFYRDFKLMTLKVNPTKWVALARRGVPFYVSALLTMVYFKINVVMLSKMRGELEVGLYMAAATLVESLFFIPEAFNTSIFPAFSRIYGISFDALRRTYEKTVKYIILVTAAVCLGTLMLGKEIILLIYGEKFLSSVSTLSILVFFWAFYFFSYTMSMLLFSIKKEKLQMQVMGFACILNVVLNLVFIPTYGFIGCAYAAVITEGCAASLMGLSLWKNKLPYKPGLGILRLGFVLGGMVITVIVLERMGVALSILGGGISYVVLLYVMGIFDSEDINAMKSLFRKQTAP